MKQPRILLLLVLIGTALALAAAGALFVASGVYDISAIHPHTRPVYHLIEQTRDRAVARRSQEVQVPPLGGTEQLGYGMALFREHCVRCHGAPGVAPEPFALGLQPLAMPLAQSGRDLDARAIYWIVRNGLKMTAMPAFGFRMDDEGLWAVVAVVQTLHTLTPTEYRSLAQAGRDLDVREAPGGEADAARGRLALGQYGCTACHAVPGWSGADVRTGPPLDGIASRLVLGGVLPNSPDNMVRWIRAPQSVTPLTAMPDLGVTERDARDIAAYLGTLK